MFNPLPRPTYRRWTMFYGTVTALLVGWLLFEEMPDGREELAGSVENAFRGSWEVLAKNNAKILLTIQDEVDDYPSQQSQDYANRAKKALELVTDVGKNIETRHIGLLHASFIMMADSDAYYQEAAAGFIDTKMTTQYLESYKSLKAAQLLVQSQGLVRVVFNYCATKVIGINENFDRLWPAFLPSTLMPIVIGETFKAEIVLSGFYNPRCNVSLCWANDQPVTLKEEVGAIHTSFPTPGLQTLHLRFRLERCRDGSITEVSRDFQVNVLERCGSKD